MTADLKVKLIVSTYLTIQIAVLGYTLYLIYQPA